MIKTILSQEIVWWQKLGSTCTVNQFQETESWDLRSSEVLRTLGNSHYTPLNNPVYFAKKAWNLA
jgi:hypothetical protein